MSKQDQPFFPQNNGMLSIAENRIEDLHRAVDRMAQKQAEYHGYAMATANRCEDYMSTHTEALTEALKCLGLLQETQAKQMTALTRIIETLERGEE